MILFRNGNYQMYKYEMRICFLKKRVKFGKMIKSVDAVFSASNIIAFRYTVCYINVIIVFVERMCTGCKNK